MLQGRSKEGRGHSILLYTAELSVCIFGAETEFRFVVFQVKQLLRVEGSTTFPDEERGDAQSKNKYLHVKYSFLEAVCLKNSENVVGSRQPRAQTHCLMKCTASSYSIPHSIRARATNTGALWNNRISRVTTPRI